MEINLQNVICGYEKINVLNNINFKFKTGEFYCILGANGVGKTTFFKTLFGFIHQKSGNILINGKEICTLSPVELARYVSYVPQAKNYTYQYTVLDIVLMGRAVYISKFSSPTDRDIKVAEDVIHNLGIEHLKGRMYSNLSGGEQQIVLIARALVQEAKFVVMDEPASNLDFENQKKVLEVLKGLSQKDIGVIMSSHSPDHAFYCGTSVILIKKDKTILTGTPEEILTENNLQEAYGVKIGIIVRKDYNGKEVRTCCLL